MYRVQTAASVMEGNLWSHVSLSTGYFHIYFLDSVMLDTRALCVKSDRL